MVRSYAVKVSHFEMDGSEDAPEGWRVEDNTVSCWIPVAACHSGSEDSPSGFEYIHLASVRGKIPFEAAFDGLVLGSEEHSSDFEYAENGSVDAQSPIEPWDNRRSASAQESEEV